MMYINCDNSKCIAERKIFISNKYIKNMTNVWKSQIPLKTQKKTFVEQLKVCEIVNMSDYIIATS